MCSNLEGSTAVFSESITFPAIFEQPAIGSESLFFQLPDGVTGDPGGRP
jgi:hypothetical protein